MNQSICMTEDVLHACRSLGRARVVLRNSFGIAEAFSDLSRINIRDGWLHLCDDSFHIHLECHTITSVRFHECKDGKHTTPAYSISFCDLAGVPMLVFALDQAQGADLLHQARRFSQLRNEFGPARLLVPGDERPYSSTLH